MNRGKTDYRVGMGASSVLMILVVLSMAALGLLAFGSARQTAALTQRNTDLSQAYYEACARVQERLALVDEVLLSASAAEGMPQADQLNGTPLGVTWQNEGQELLFTLTEPAGEGRMLLVSGRALQGGNKRYELTRHTLTTAQGQDDGEPLVLMGE